MTKFTNGPAAGVVLSLRRAPMFLRAVQNAKGTWDALDQLDDEPKADETVTVYRRSEYCGMVHLRMAKGSGYYAMAAYEVHDPQPSKDECVDDAKWRAWAYAEAAKLQPAEPEESKT